LNHPRSLFGWWVLLINWSLNGFTSLCYRSDRNNLIGSWNIFLTVRFNIFVLRSFLVFTRSHKIGLHAHVWLSWSFWVRRIWIFPFLTDLFIWVNMVDIINNVYFVVLFNKEVIIFNWLLGKSFICGIIILKLCIAVFVPFSFLYKTRCFVQCWSFVQLIGLN
jgi:hypothetical protein